MSILVCPVCGKSLERQGNSLKCSSNHSFDYAKDGYVNLLISNKNGDKIGDSRESAHARHSFLAKGYYDCLRQAVSKKLEGAVLDICCGEGYYDLYDGTLYGFDISKEMVRLAAKQNKNASYFVANLSHIPVSNESIDTAMHLFAPFNDREFSRVLKPDGVLYSVIPGKNHLIEMKQVIYDTPYQNDEQPPKAELLRLVDTEKVSQRVKISGDDLKELFSMTPYFYRTPAEYKQRLDTVDELELTVEFVILKYVK